MLIYYSKKSINNYCGKNIFTILKIVQMCHGFHRTVAITLYNLYNYTTTVGPINIQCSADVSHVAIHPTKSLLRVDYWY